MPFECIRIVPAHHSWRLHFLCLFQCYWYFKWFRLLLDLYCKMKIIGHFHSTKITIYRCRSYILFAQNVMTSYFPVVTSTKKRETKYNFRKHILTNSWAGMSVTCSNPWIYRQITLIEIWTTRLFHKFK